MILNEALRSTTQSLIAARIDCPLIEAELLLGHVLGMSKTQIHTEPESTLTLAETKCLQCLVQRRLHHEPTAYILRSREFYGIDFYTDNRTLIPRPETELLVEKTIESAYCLSYPEKQITIADIGTGCGAIAISLALALPKVKIYAVDISATALQVAEINCQRHRVGNQVELLHGNLLEPLPHAMDIIVANLPYIKSCEFKDLSPEITEFEPTIALSGGEDGLDKIRQLLRQIPGKLNSGGCFLLEIGQGQDKAVTSLINSYFPQLTIELIPDLGGINRVIRVEN